MRTLMKRQRKQQNYEFKESNDQFKAFIVQSKTPGKQTLSVQAAAGCLPAGPGLARVIVGGAVGAHD